METKNLNSIALYKVPNALQRFDNQKKFVPAFSHQTLYHIKEIYGFDNVNYVVSLNGIVIPEWKLKEIRPQVGDTVVLMTKIEGSDNGTLMMVAMVCIMIIAAVTQQYWVAAMGPEMSAAGAGAGMAFVESAGVMSAGMATFTGTLVAGAIMMGGGLLVNGLLGGSSNDVANTDPATAGTSAAYSWQPQNTQQPGLSLPKWYGTVRVFGNIIATDTEVNPTSDLTQYINVLLCLGHGPCQQLYGWEINDQPAENFAGITKYERLGYLNQQFITNFNDTKVEYAVHKLIKCGVTTWSAHKAFNIGDLILVNDHTYRCTVSGTTGAAQPSWNTGKGEVTKDLAPLTWTENSITYTTEDGGFTKMEIDITFPNGLCYYNTSGNPVDSGGVEYSVYIKHVDDIGWSCITQSGTSHKTVMVPGWYGAFYYDYSWDNETNSGTPAHWGDPVINGVPGESYYEGQFCAASSPYYWAPVYLWHNFGVEMTVSDVIDSKIANKSPVPTSSVTFTEKVNIPTNRLGQYDIKVVRITADRATDGRYRDLMTLGTVRLVTEDNFEYPRHVLSGFNAISSEQLNGNFKASCIMQGAIMHIPVIDKDANNQLLTTPKTYITGTVSTIVGYEITGSLTKWLDNVEVGDLILLDGDTTVYSIYRVSSDTSIGVYPAYNRIRAGVSYTIYNMYFGFKDRDSDTTHGLCTNNAWVAKDILTQPVIGSLNRVSGLTLEIPTWTASTFYDKGDLVRSIDNRTIFTCTTGGKSSTTEPNWQLRPGSTTNENTIGLKYPTPDATHVKVTSIYGASYQGYFSTDPAKSLIGICETTQWLSTGDINQRFHIDLGSSTVVSRIYYENHHATGANVSGGVRNFTLWGSNNINDFNELTYETDGTWTIIETEYSAFAQHTTSNAADPQYIDILNNTTSYQYYAFKFADNHGYASYMGVRRIVLQNLIENSLSWKEASVVVRYDGVDPWQIKLNKFVECALYNSEIVTYNSAVRSIGDVWANHSVDLTNSSLALNDITYDSVTGTYVIAPYIDGYIYTSSSSIYPVVGRGNPGVIAKATSTYSNSDYLPQSATDTSKPIVDGWSGNVCWLSASSMVTEQRFHMDLGSAIVITKIYYENGHHNGDYWRTGVKNFTLWGSNTLSAFNDTTWDHDIDWAPLTTGSDHFEKHINSNIPDPQHITVNNTVAYRYYAFKFEDSYVDDSSDGTYGPYMSLRRIVLQNDTYGLVGATKSTTQYNTNHYPWLATDPSIKLVDSPNAWLSLPPSSTSQRFHIDLGGPTVVTRIYYENYHDSGATTNAGVNNFTLWGSNTLSAFNDTVWDHDTYWVPLTTGHFEEHTTSNVPEPQYIVVSNTEAYQYYAFKFADNHGNTDYMGIRRLVLQTSERGDTTTWIKRLVKNIASAKMTSICWSSDLNLFVATTYDGTMSTIITSRDTVSWTNVHSITRKLNHIRCLNSNFIAVGEQGVLLTSYDGVTWNAPAVPSLLNLNSLTYGNGTYVTCALGTGGILTSTDVGNWSVVVPTAADSATNVADLVLSNNIIYGCGQFVSAGKHIYTSPDATVWTKVFDATLIDGTIVSLTYGSNTFVAVSSNNAMYISTDSTHWSKKGVTSNRIYNGVYDNLGFVLVGTNNTIMLSHTSEGFVQLKETRFDFNGGFDSEYDMFTAANKVLGECRATLVLEGNKYSLSVDKSTGGEYTQVFTVADIDIDSFKETFLQLEDRASEVDVDFKNVDKNWEKDQVGYIDREMISKNNKVSLQLIGCTRVSEAWRHAKYTLNNNKYKLRTQEFKVDTEAIVASIGDVVKLQHDAGNYGIGGNIISSPFLRGEWDSLVSYAFNEVVCVATINYRCLVANTNKPPATEPTYWEVDKSMFLDKQVSLVPYTTYTMLIRYSNDDLESKVVSAPSIWVKNTAYSKDTPSYVIPTLDILWQGEWQSHEPYVYGDGVYVSTMVNSIEYKVPYKCLIANTGEAPFTALTNYWEIVTNDANYQFKCIVSGTSSDDSTEPDWTQAPNPGDIIEDGSVTWVNDSNHIVSDTPFSEAPVLNNVFIFESLLLTSKLVRILDRQLDIDNKSSITSIDYDERVFYCDTDGTTFRGEWDSLISYKYNDSVFSISYGPELINSPFEEADWTFPDGSGWSIVGGILTKVADITSNTAYYKTGSNFTTGVGIRYRIDITYTIPAGEHIIIYLGALYVVGSVSNGLPTTETFYIVTKYDYVTGIAISTGQNSDSGTITSFSVHECLEHTQYTCLLANTNKEPVSNTNYWVVNSTGEPEAPNYSLQFNIKPKIPEVVGIVLDETARVNTASLAIERSIVVSFTLDNESVFSKADILLSGSNDEGVTYSAPLLVGTTNTSTFTVLDPSLEGDKSYRVYVKTYNGLGQSKGLVAVPYETITLTDKPNYATSELGQRVTGLHIYGKTIETDFDTKNVTFEWNNFTIIDPNESGTSDICTANNIQNWFNYYEVIIRDLDGDIRANINSNADGVRRVKTNMWTYTYEDNCDDDPSGLGIPISSFTVEIKVVDKYNNKSDIPATLTVANTVPNMVTGLTGSSEEDGAKFTWNAVTNTDLDGYEVNISVGDNTSYQGWVYKGQKTEFSYSLTNTEQQVQGKGTLDIYCKVRAKDVFGQYGTECDEENTSTENKKAYPVTVSGTPGVGVYTTLQDAIDALTGYSGGTIKIKEGTYSNIAIAVPADLDIRIEGEGDREKIILQNTVNTEIFLFPWGHDKIFTLDGVTIESQNTLNAWDDYTLITGVEDFGPVPMQHGSWFKGKYTFNNVAFKGKYDDGQNGWGSGDTCIDMNFFNNSDATLPEINITNCYVNTCLNFVSAGCNVNAYSFVKVNITNNKGTNIRSLGIEAASRYLNICDNELTDVFVQGIESYTPTTSKEFFIENNSIRYVNTPNFNAQQWPYGLRLPGNTPTNCMVSIHNNTVRMEMTDIGHIVDAIGIYVGYTGSNTKVTNNTVIMSVDSTYMSGLMISDINNSHINTNNIQIDYLKTNGPQNHYGIKILDCNDNDISNNLINMTKLGPTSSDIGIWLESGTSGNVGTNSIFNYGVAIQDDGSNDIKLA